MTAIGKDAGGWTPGPWSVGPAHVVRQQTIDGEGRRVTRFVAEAVLSLPFVKEGEREANARLIAAAPELYEVLAGICAGFPADAPALIEARRVLAKARSESAQMTQGEEQER